MKSGGVVLRFGRVAAILATPQDFAADPKEEVAGAFQESRVMLLATLDTLFELPYRGRG